MNLIMKYRDYSVNFEVSDPFWVSQLVLRTEGLHSTDDQRFEMLEISSPYYASQKGPN